MKKELKILSGGKEKSLFYEDDYKNIISDHFEFIEKQCFKAVRLKLRENSSAENTLTIENEALELSNQVLDTLKRDNYKVLREFKGNARLTTYITAIISRQAVDLIRKKRGRDREKERAKKFGDVGFVLYQQVIKDGYPLLDVFEELQANHGFSGSMDELETIVQKIKGKGKQKNPRVSLLNGSNSSTNGSAVKNGTTIGIYENEFVIPDTQSDPEKIVMEDQRKRKMQEVIQDIIAQLNGEERILLRMRFPSGEDETPRTVAQVSNILGITQKAVYKRMTRLLKKCKELLDREGVTINDLL
jgi:RNA polymerase sigma factor (sigma-70 family)